MQIIFAGLVALILFQEFLNYLLPVSLRNLYFLFYAYCLFDATVGGLMKNRTLTLLGAAILTLVGYGMVVLLAGFSVGTVTIFVSTTYPFVIYLFVRNNGYLFSHRLYRFSYGLLLFITVFGFFEYFFAQYFLADMVARYGRGITEAYLDTGLYLQKINTSMVGVYRSMSFIMEFVYFGYFAMFTFFMATANFFHEGGKRNFLWAALAFLGLLSSVTISAIGMALVGLGFLILFKARFRTKVILGSLLAAAVLISVPILMNLSDDVAFKPLLRIGRVLAGEDHQTKAHFGEQERIIPLFGTSWRVGYEHEYFDALYRLGVYGGVLYMGISAFFLWKSIRIAFRAGPLQSKAIPIALLFVAFLGIGLTHHTLEVGVAVLAFLFLGMIENSYGEGDRGIPLAPAPAAGMFVRNREP